MVSFVHTADWQIGMKGGALGPVAAARVADERIGAVDRLLALAAERQADFVLAAGDLFEDNRLDEDLVARLAAVLRAHPGVPIYAIPGNHDVVGPGSPWRTAALAGLGHLSLLETTDPVALTAADGTRVVLFPCPVRTRHAYGDPLDAIPDAPAGPDHVRIGLAHGHLSTITFGADHEDLRLPLDPQQVGRAGLDYLALGHWHSTKLEPAPDGVLRIAYSGTPEQSRFEEGDAGNVLVVTLAGPGATPVIEPVRVGALRWRRLEHAFTGEASIESLTRALEAPDVRNADLVALRVSGELPASLDPAYQALMEAAAARFAHFRVKDRDLRFVPDLEALAAATRLGDPILAAVRATLAAELGSAPESQGDVVREALRLLLQYHGEELGEGDGRGEGQGSGEGEGGSSAPPAPAQAPGQEVQP